MLMMSVPSFFLCSDFSADGERFVVALQGVVGLADRILDLRNFVEAGSDSALLAETAVYGNGVFVIAQRLRGLFSCL